ncbi:Protein of unknown function [Gryllus bimaculatus]|nr:Protein of unknown function [Gryllus bimaculatus]
MLFELSEEFTHDEYRLGSASEETAPAPPPTTARPSANATEEGEEGAAEDGGGEDAGYGEAEELSSAPGPAACAVPAAWRMEVLYDKTPHARWIAGARLTYVATPWEEHVWKAPVDDESQRYSLWSSVLFSRRLPPEPPLSRFWARVLSPEGAEWAWANAWRALREPLTPADVADLALVLLLAALGLAAAALRCLDADCAH